MTRRWPPLVLIAALVVGALVVGRGGGTDGAAARATDPTTLLPVGPPADALGSAWFCAGQSAGDDTIADGTVVVANLGDETARGTLEVVTGDDDRESQALEVAAHTTERVRLAEVVEADWVAARVELDRGDVVVEHEVVGPQGRDVAPCQTRSGDRWYFPAGGSTRDARLLLAVYNPSPDAAVVDMAFATEEGVREPTAFQGMPVAAGSLVVVDVAAVVTVREVISSTVTTRRGRVVVDRIQTYDGRGASASEEEAAEETYRRKGLTITPGVPQPRPAWSFPGGVRSAGVHERVVVYNPGDELAEVEIQVDLDQPERNGVLDPFPLTVAAGEFAVFDLDEADAVPDGVRHSLTVRSTNGVRVVAERSIDAAGDATYRGVATSTGSPVAARQWAFAAGRRPVEEESERVIVVNPGDRAVTVRVVAFGDGERAEVAVEGGTIRLEPGARREVVLDDVLTDERTSIQIVASGPVVAERRLIAQPTAAGDEEEEGGDAEEEPGVGASVALGIPFGSTIVLFD